MVLGPVARSASNEAEILQHINLLRGIKPTSDEARLAELNARMDSAWKFLEEHKTEAAPMVERELNAALANPLQDQFFVLDTGKLLLSLKGKQAQSLAVKALSEIDPNAEIIQYNFKELFDFTYQLAKLGSPEVLTQIDRIFLTNTNGLNFFSAPHSVKFDATDLCVFLYGVTELDAEAHLLSIADNTPAALLRILEVLSWLGSENCTKSVKRILDSSGDLGMFQRAVTVLLTVGGPAGREAVLRTEPSRLDTDSRSYFEKILSEVKLVSEKTLKETLKKVDHGPRKRLTDAQLKTRLKKMYENYGADDETSPTSIVTSSLPKEYVLKEMKRIRARSFYRLNNHALDDVQITNFIINTLQFAP
jgi:hypothetical protein